MDEHLTSSKAWKTMRREEGERRATTTVADEAEGASGDFFDIKRPRLPYPQSMEQHVRPVQYAWDDPFGHMGRVGYTRNTYQFKGPNKDDNNIYGGQHMKKTLWLEEMRRRIIAEAEGISADVDETSVAGTAEAYYINTHVKRNPYLRRDNTLAREWKIANPHSSNQRTLAR